MCTTAVARNCTSWAARRAGRQSSSRWESKDQQSQHAAPRPDAAAAQSKQHESRELWNESHRRRRAECWWGGADDEDAGNVDIDKQIEMTFKSKKSVKETVVGADEQGESKLFFIIPS